MWSIRERKFEGYYKMRMMLINNGDNAAWSRNMGMGKATDGESPTEIYKIGFGFRTLTHQIILCC